MPCATGRPRSARCSRGTSSTCAAAKLSATGTFSSSPEQVAKIFNEFIPEYAAKQKGQPARVLFFAHGGLVEEEEGLLAVLARRRFFEMNGVYPVYFVWETGLKETVRDIVGAAIPKRGERGAPTDLAIEKLARNGGKQVWWQMKKSAQKAADPDGGARLVAELAGKLWKATRGDGRVPRPRPQRRRDLPRVLPAAAGGAEAGRRAAGRRADAPLPRAGESRRICSRSG